MTPEQLEEVKTEVASTVRVVVNGKILAMSEKFDAYIVDDMEWKKTVDSYMNEMKPVKDGLFFVQTLNRFIKWLGIGSIGAIVAYWFMK